MILEIKGKTYHTVRISINGEDFTTPKKNSTKTIEVNNIPKSLLDLEEKDIIKINIKN